MSTARDLLTVALDAESGGDGGSPGHPVEQGDLSLALAGAELVDLLDAEAVRLEDGHLVPGLRPSFADRLLDEAASSLVQQAPYGRESGEGPPYGHTSYETVEEWLWRRGRSLAAAYLTAFEAEGRLLRRHPRWMPFRTGRMDLADSPDRRRAADRLAAHEPVLAGLATTAGIEGAGGLGEAPDLGDDAVAAVLAAVGDAVEELAAVRQRRSVEQAAFDNIWRGDGM